MSSPGEVERPKFARTYPRDEALDELVDAFEIGNYARVRREAPALADSDDAKVRAAALDLQRRIRPDPTAVYLLLVGFGLLVFLYWHYAGHAH